MQVTARLSDYRVSPRKARLLADQVRGKRIEEALTLDAKQVRTRIKLGQVFMHMGMFEEAQRLKDEIIESSQDNRDIARAAKLEQEEKYADAEGIYRRILTRNPENVAAMRLWARLGIREKHYRDAEVLLKRAVKVAPAFSRAWADLCEVQCEMEKFDDAIESARRMTLRS